MSRDTMKRWWKPRLPLFVILVVLLTITISTIKIQLDLSAVDLDIVAFLDEMQHAKRDGMHSILPKNVKKVCAGLATAKEYSACRLQIQWENGIFAVVTTITAVAFLSILCFMLMKYSRKSKARRLTRFHDPATLYPPSQVTASSQCSIDNVRKASYRWNAAVVANTPQVSRMMEARNETARQAENPAQNEAGDEWYTIWTRQHGHVRIQCLDILS